MKFLYNPRNRWIALLFSVIVLLTYRDVWFIYFQQDEWFWFKKILLFDHYGIWNHFQVVSNHFTPLFSLQFDLMMRLFGFNTFFYGLYNFVLHYINTVLVFVFAKKVTRSEKIGIIAGALFAVAATPVEAVTWYGTSPMSLPSTTCGLFALLLFHSYLQKGQIKKLIQSLALIIIGSLFYESLIALFLFLIVWALIEKRNRKDTISWSMLVGVLFFIFRSLLQVTQGITIKVSYATYLATVVHHLIKFIPLGFSQLFVPTEWVYQTSLALIQYNQPDILQMIPKEWDMYFNLDNLMRTFFLSFTVIIVLSLLIYIAIPFAQRERKKYIILFFLFCIINFLPFSLLPQSGLESRHFYFITIGSSVMLGIIIERFFEKIGSPIGKLLIIFLVTYYMGFQIHFIRDAVVALGRVSAVRATIVHDVVSTYKTVPPRVIFYSTTGVLPFQSGFGETLMVNYASQHSYIPFFKTEFLTHMGEQGYQEMDGVGFG